MGTSPHVPIRSGSPFCWCVRPQTGRQTAMNVFLSFYYLGPTALPKLQIQSIYKYVALFVRLSQIFKLCHTSQDYQYFYKWTKTSSLQIDIFGLKMTVKSGLDFFYFEIHPAPSEIPANRPNQINLFGQTFCNGQQ